MIVTHLKHSYPNLVDDVRAGHNNMAPTLRLEGFTPRGMAHYVGLNRVGISRLRGGTWGDIIVSAFEANTIVPTADSKEKLGDAEEKDGNRSRLNASLEAIFTSNVNVSVDPAEWLIGCSIPGGPWKLGESRGTGRYAFETYLDDYPSLLPWIGEDFGGRMAPHLIEHFAGTRHDDLSQFPALVEGGSGVVAGGTDVTVVRQPGGTVVVTIPTGTPAQILIEP